jgi:hypothetical protein
MAISKNEKSTLNFKRSTLFSSATAELAEKICHENHVSKFHDNEMLSGLNELVYLAVTAELWWGSRALASALSTFGSADRTVGNAL